MSWLLLHHPCLIDQERWHSPQQSEGLRTNTSSWTISVWPHLLISIIDVLYCVLLISQLIVLWKTSSKPHWLSLKSLEYTDTCHTFDRHYENSIYDITRTSLARKEARRKHHLSLHTPLPCRWLGRQSMRFWWRFSEDIETLNHTIECLYLWHSYFVQPWSV